MMNFKSHALKRMHIRTSMKGSLNYSLRPSVPLEIKKKTQVPGKEVILIADKRLFGNMVLVATSRNLDMREVLAHPSGLLLWALSKCDVTLKKTKQINSSKTY